MKKQKDTNCNAQNVDKSVDKSLDKISQKESKLRKGKSDVNKGGVTEDAPFSTAEYVMVKPGYEDEEINTQQS